MVRGIASWCGGKGGGIVTAVSGLSIGVLAERTHMSKSGLFAHFGSKEELQLQVLQAAVALFQEQVIRPALKGVGQDHPLILDADCTACGRCVDVCGKDVFRITTRFNRSES